MPLRSTRTLGRRAALLAMGGLGAAALAGLARRRRARDDDPPPLGAPVGAGVGSDSHAPAGRVEPPAEPPRIAMLGADGAELELPTWLQRRPTALQLVFTRCTSTCPIQGALFAAVAPRLAHRAGGPRLLSVSIDPDHDTPAALRAWMARFGASSAWYAATPRTPAGVDALFDFLRGRAQGLDRHSLRAYLFDAQGRLAYRTTELPPASEIIGALERLAST